MKTGCAALRRATAMAGSLFWLLGIGVPGLAADGTAPHPGAPAMLHPDFAPSTAYVEIDGVELFRVVGVPAFPAAQRAAAIVGRIETLAADRAFNVEGLSTSESEIGTSIMAGDRRVMLVTDDDARLEGVGRKVIASVYAKRMGEAIEAWRAARTPEALERSTVRAVLASVVFGLAFALVLWLRGRLAALLERRYHARIHSVGIQSFHVLRAEHIWGVVQGFIGAVRVLTLLVLAFAYLYYVLRLFPWTYGVGVRLLEYGLDPLRIIGRGFLAHLPSLVFLAVLFVITRWLLKVIHLFFRSVARGEVTLRGFEAEWAEPTYKIARLLVIVFVLIVAYPYIPGSDSDAFKGISLFIGLVFSLGSSSIIANILAGYMMTYRRAFKIGDRVKIGDIVGDVTEMRLQVTHLKTVQNEEVIVPNSTILNNEVVNYSTLARSQGLILRTAVGIGYETPWRQVEALLLQAARRTAGLMSEPSAFVRQKALGDFAVVYELHAYCNDPQATGVLYTELHRNILDVFNEYGVQIMTPVYEGDPPEPKVVPKDRWFAPPAIAASAAPPKPAIVEA